MFKVDNQYANANIPRTIRFTDTIYEELNKTAKESDVSFNMLVLQCCRYALDRLRQGDEKDGN